MTDNDLSAERIKEIADYIADGYPHPCNPIEHMKLCKLAIDGLELTAANARIAELAAALASTKHPDPDTTLEIRNNDDGSLDEIVGYGDFHLEQMNDNHWWLLFGDDVHIHLTARGKVKATVSDERVAELSEGEG